MKTLIAILFIGLFASCRPEEKVIPYTYKEASWVINSRISDDGSLWVGVSYSLPPDYLSSGKTGLELLESLMIDSLTVEIDFQGTKVRLSEAAKGVYVHRNANLTAGTVVQIEVFDRAGKSRIKSSSMVQAVAEVPSMDAYGVKDNGDTNFFAEFTIRKPVNEEAWYVVSLTKASDLQKLQSGSKPSLGKILSDRNLMEKRAYLLKSSDFSGETIEIKKELNWLTSADTLVVQISRIEKPYFHFLEAVLRSSGWFQQLLGDAVNYPGNVAGGLGYFTLHQSVNRAFVMKSRIK